MKFLSAAQQFLTDRAKAYRQTFVVADQANAVVLADLAKFCRAHESTAHPDSHMAARLDGRREVWLRIQQHIQLDDETLWKLFGAPAK